MKVTPSNSKNGKTSLHYFLFPFNVLSNLGGDHLNANDSNILLFIGGKIAPVPAPKTKSD